jgi:hypothetical protein
MRAKIAVSLCVFAAAAAAGPAMAHVCRIERVEQAGPNAVRLYFGPGPWGAMTREVKLFHGGAVQTFKITGRPAPYSPAPPSPPVTAVLGDKLSSSNPFCDLTVMTVKGRLGVGLRGMFANRYPGLRTPGPETDAFIPAR